jgi:hypothetical protein
MEKQLTTVTQLPLSDIMNIGKAFAESGMFADTKSAAQAIVKIQAGQEIGIPPFAAMTGIHIIQGKPTIGAGLIASRLKGSGKYDYRVITNDEKLCSIDFYQGKDLIGNSTFTIDDAKKAGTKNLDKFPKNMLFARAISNGVKWYTPDIFSGPVYVPEEMPTITEDAVHIEVQTQDQLADAKTFLYAAQDLASLNKAFKSLSKEMQQNAEVIEVASKCKVELSKQAV